MSVSEAKYAALLQRIEELENDNRFRSHVAALRQEIEDMNKDYFTEVSLGNVPGSTAGFAIGVNRGVGTAAETFVGDQGGLNTDLGGATQLYISSSSASDTDVDVVISNIDENYVSETLTVTTNGQTQVAISAATGFDVQVMLVTGSTTPVGDLYLAETDTLTGGVPDTASKIRAIIPLSVTEAGAASGAGTDFASDNISHLGRVTVPAGKQMLIYTIIVGTNKNDNVKIQGRVRFFGGPWLNRNPIPAYQSNVPVVFNPPLLLPEKTSLQFMATGGSVDSNAQVQAFFILRDN